MTILLNIKTFPFIILYKVSTSRKLKGSPKPERRALRRRLSGFGLLLFVSQSTQSMYNHSMSKQQPRKRLSMIFLVLGMAFLAIGLATDQTVFTWLSIAFIVISLVVGGRWLRPRK
jgi:hypothetical protein